MKLPEISVKRPVLTIVLYLAIVVLGFVSYQRLSVDFLPEIEPPIISVLTAYRGASAPEVEINVSKRIETSLSAISNLKKIRSTSVDNVSAVILEFEYGTNLDEAANDIRNALELAKSALPDGVDNPVVYKFSTNMMPVVMLGVTANESYMGLNKLIDDKVVNHLKRVPGVGTVQIIGGPKRQIIIDVDPKKLEAYNLSVARIGQILSAENLNVPAGSIKMGRIEYNVRTIGEFQSAKEIERVVVGQQGGRLVYLKDVATVRDSLEEGTRDVRLLGNRGLLLMIQKQSGANTVKVAREVFKELEVVKKGLPTDVQIEKIMDSAEYIVDSINNLAETILYAFVFVSLVILIFLRKWRATVIVLLTIPVSLIGAFVYLYFSGNTINIISLSALAIAIGMVVDDAIVILENTTRHVERGARPREAAIFGSSEVGLAVMASTLTIVAVFFPLVFITGLSGILFNQLGVMVTLTILISLFAALTIVPMLSSRLLTSRKEEKPIKNPTLRKIDDALGRMFNALDDFYQRVLNWALDHRKTTVFIAAGIFVGSLALLPVVGTEFMPKADEAQMTVAIELQSGTRLEETLEIVQKVENIIKHDFPEVSYFSASSGTTTQGFSAILFGRSEGSHITNFTIRTTKKSERKRSIFEIADALRQKISPIPGIKTLSITTGGMGSNFMGGAAIEVDVIGANLDETGKIANQLKEFMTNLKGTRDVKINVSDPKPELQIRLNREKLALNGLTTATVATTLRNNVYGLTASTYREMGDEYDIFLQYPPSERSSVTQLENLPIPTPVGGTVRLKDLGVVEQSYSPSEIKRKNQERVITVSSDVSGRPLGDVTADIKNYVATLNLPPTVSIEYGGQVEQQAESFQDLGLLLLLSIVLVYMVMAAQFESFLDPFIVMFSVPFAITGVIFGLLVSGSPLNIMALLGAVMLVGIVVKNAIVLVDFTNITRARNVPLREAIIYSGRNRLRPVLMTTLTTLLGTLPLALSSGQGSEMWSPLGIATVGGLFFSSIITLVLVPVLYSLFETRIKKGQVID